MRSCWSSQAKRFANTPDADGGVEVLLHLAQMQLLAQMLDSDNVDGQSTGVLGLNGALLAADLAAKSAVGTSWWFPLPGLALSTAVLLGLRRGLCLELGPEPRAFYAAYGGQPGRRTGLVLLSDLDGTLRRNDRTLERKERRLALAVAVITITVMCSVAVFV